MPKGVYQKTKEHLEKFLKIGKRTRFVKGQNFSKEIIKKSAISRTGKYIDEKNPLWKGDKVKYQGLHIWVRKRLGKAHQCEHCGKLKTTPKSIQWANKSREYKRDLTDWISLCVPCHREYDRTT